VEKLLLSNKGLLPEEKGAHLARTFTSELQLPMRLSSLQPWGAGHKGRERAAAERGGEEARGSRAEAEVDELIPAGALYALGLKHRNL